MPLNLQGENRLLQLAMEAAVRAIEEKSAGQLHRQRAGTLRRAAADHIAPRRFEHARKIHAPVLLEVLVLRAEDGVVQDGGNLRVSYQDAPLQGERADGLPIVRVQLRDDDRAIILQRVYFRQVARVNEQQPDGRAERNRANDQKGKRQPPEQRPAADLHRRAIEPFIHRAAILSHGTWLCRNGNSPRVSRNATAAPAFGGFTGWL